MKKLRSARATISEKIFAFLWIAATLFPHNGIEKSKHQLGTLANLPEVKQNKCWVSCVAIPLKID